MVLKHDESQNNTGQMAMVNCNDKLINQSSTSTPSPSYSYSSMSPFIYVTDDRIEDKPLEKPVKSRVKECYDIEMTGENHTGFPLFFQSNIATIFIPKKVKTHLERFVPNQYLKNIDRDKNIAIEKCLAFVSNLSSTYYADDRFKSLSSTNLDEQSKRGRDNTFVYNHIIKALTYSTNTIEAIIMVKKNKFGNETYQEGVVCKEYGFTDAYFKGDLVEYIIKDKGILQKRNKFFYSQLKKAHDNPIANNLISLYSTIELPSHAEIRLQGKRLTKVNYRTKKGKILTFLNKHPKSYYKDASARSFVEQNIKLFDYLTKRGFMIPIIGTDKSGGRVVDSFTLMPSWIRSLVKIDGKSIVEVDYSALHPNIAMSLYGGLRKYLTHIQVAENSNIDLSNVKIAHLSYFNERVQGMKRSPIYSYYSESEMVMNEAIIKEKQMSLKEYRITSMRMFAKEVEIMTECIKQLNYKGIYVGYVYDSLFCEESDAKLVAEIMNTVVLKFNVFTTAKIG
ncbi:hypothetical protein CXF59_12320 [Flavobacterium sp. ALD4]|uniref:hypothetical protein n=1 Tax=Flavobacterium sp. ALD4 TaxID=2058314 RepID=UPI000C32146D|nr:hypothetical protein [Flavobacterium sp. ALD4]PKH66703.1 hypothetical protein CXF59_12320 [Flavobacterium sp. ALD4]